MLTRLTRTCVPRASLLFALFLVLGVSTPAFAAVISYEATLDGPSESPPVASSGTGTAIVDIDPVAHTMRVRVTFSGLTGTVTASHIHGPTTSAGSGTAGVMTATPTFPGFPSGVSAGTYDQTFDMTQAGSYNPTFLANAPNLGSTATAEATLFQAIADGKAYLNIHSNIFPGGEIRGFLHAPLATEASTWGQVKALYR